MSEIISRNRFVDPEADAYAAAHSMSPDEVQLGLQAVTLEQTGNWARMQIGNDQALLFEMLGRAMGARRVVEIGTFTGYSALALARGIGPEGHVLCLDISEEWTAIAREFWDKAGVGNRIELRVGPALASLRALPMDEQFDLAFVDADKGGYLAYYEELIPRLRSGGLLLADNTLQSGRVYDDEADDDDTRAIRIFNDRVAADPRVQVVLMAIGDGVSFVQKL